MLYSIPYKYNYLFYGYTLLCVSFVYVCACKNYTLYKITQRIGNTHLIKDVYVKSFCRSI